MEKIANHSRFIFGGLGIALIAGACFGQSASQVIIGGIGGFLFILTSYIFASWK